MRKGRTQLRSLRTALSKSLAVFPWTDPSGKGWPSSWGTEIHSQEVSATDHREMTTLLPTVLTSRAKSSVHLVELTFQKAGPKNKTLALIQILGFSLEAECFFLKSFFCTHIYFYDIHPRCPLIPSHSIYIPFSPRQILLLLSHLGCFKWLFIQNRWYPHFLWLARLLGVWLKFKANTPKVASLKNSYHTQNFNLNMYTLI